MDAGLNASEIRDLIKGCQLFLESFLLVVQRSV